MSGPPSIPVAAFCQEDGPWLLFDRPRAVVFADRIDAVLPCLEEIERYVSDGWHAAGFIGYEAAPAFDASLDAFAPDGMPLLWFGIFGKPLEAQIVPPGSACNADPQWRPTIAPEEYRTAVDRIKEYIAQGDTYQVNYTFRLRARFEHDPWNYFRLIVHSHPVPYATWIDAGRYKVCSFSPELFFRLDGERITVQPMKGTSRRGRFTGEDLLLGERLQRDAKERAENIMIVDMVRSDLGRIAATGSVSVPELCAIRHYRSIVQMVSTVRAEVTAPLHAIFTALFPCASITGAPKIRTSRIIRELESTPRHIYCGAIGWCAPRRRACFNVAIRTLLFDGERKTAEYGTGSGIVWESDGEREYEECRLKAVIVASQPPDFRLLETLLWTPGEGYFLFEPHLDRLMDSATYFSFRVDGDEVLHVLTEQAASFESVMRRVRLLVDRTGAINVESSPLRSEGVTERDTIELYLAERPVDSTDCFLFHKTTRRNQYDALRREFPAGDDLLFRNERGEITETIIGNIVVQIDEKLYTPLVKSGLLAGVFRGELLAQGTIREKNLTINDLLTASRIFRINSVRKWEECRLCGLPPATTRTLTQAVR
ncbi:MAG: aminodeoxychorismate synthase component I [Chitinispirillaceae bacterium]|nr:aminodeoxychorismate synthase component I [Chitinispirillaceae bacterium]